MYVVGFVLYFHFNERNNAQNIHNRSTVSWLVINFPIASNLQIHISIHLVGNQAKKNNEKNKRNQMASARTDDDDNDNNKPGKCTQTENAQYLDSVRTNL